MQQLTFVDVEPAMEMVQQADYMLKNYGWMAEEVERLKSALADAGEGTVGSWEPNAGIRAQYKNSDKTGGEVARRDRKYRRLLDMQERVALFDAALKTITDPQESMMMDCLLDGETVTMIACRLDVSRRHAQDIKRRLVRKLAWAMYDKGNGSAA